ncbi:hypothetical protein PoB_004011700 [Plakobranchus ocellatus]|uniref:Bindin n=1 Tax=Plakobranchus ocellatus TaxID=259542 RepID=A0AAV4B247_9GAST|nr:hypothetical protein PoB_004011700 [Plakobranchus ocellatus]
MWRFRSRERRRWDLQGQFKSPGQGLRGQQFGRQQYLGGQGYQFGPGSYPGTPVHPGQQGYPGQMGMERRISSAGSEGDSFLQGQGEESYDYQQFASDDSRDTQHSVGGDPNQTQAGFHGAFGNGGQSNASQTQSGNKFSSDPGGGGGESGATGQQQQQGPPDIKVEALPVPFMSTNEFELIEIDPDEEEDI